MAICRECLQLYCRGGRQIAGNPYNTVHYKAMCAGCQTTTQGRKLHFERSGQECVLVCPYFTFSCRLTLRWLLLHPQGHDVQPSLLIRPFMFSLLHTPYTAHGLSSPSISLTGDHGSQYCKVSVDIKIHWQ